MPNVVLTETGCRDCSLCVDICPTRVFDRDEGRAKALVAREADCIGCTSCQYLCPSRCIEVSDVAKQRPFFRIEENTNLVQRLLQKQPVASALTEADLKEALVDVSFRLLALSESVTETMGRGQKAVGRKAGALAAAHLPEMYEGATIDDVLVGMQHRFAGAFDFEPTVGAGGSEIVMRFPSCGMRRVVTQAGGKVGEHVLCLLFHEYWAGLVGAFTRKNFAIDMTETGASCTMKLVARN